MGIVNVKRVYIIKISFLFKYLRDAEQAALIK